MTFGQTLKYQEGRGSVVPTLKIFHVIGKIRIIPKMNGKLHRKMMLPKTIS